MEIVAKKGVEVKEEAKKAVNKNEFKEAFEKQKEKINMKLKYYMEQVALAHQELVIDKINKKGLGKFLEKKRRFPKFTTVRKNGWFYVFFDNKTIEGEFIVAIKDEDPSKVNIDKIMASDKFKINIERQDKNYDDVRIVDVEPKK